MDEFLWGLWTGLRAFPILIAHALSWAEEYQVYDSDRADAWYQFGYLLGAGLFFFLLGLFTDPDDLH